MVNSDRIFLLQVPLAFLLLIAVVFVVPFQLLPVPVKVMEAGKSEAAGIPAALLPLAAPFGPFLLPRRQPPAFFDVPLRFVRELHLQSLSFARRSPPDVFEDSGQQIR
jgi:uncharacterized protein (DUF58 family)